MTNRLVSITLAMILTGAFTAAHADSLYAGPASASATTIKSVPISYFTDPRAKSVGDVLTVVITESATGSATATTTGSKSESGNFGPGFGNILRMIRQFGLSGSESSNATGASNRADSLNATIACTVKAVLPNGNLQIQGSRTVGVNAEAQTITLDGVVRPIDVAQNNTVQSPLVADAKISYSGKGPVGEMQHDGIIRQIFRFLF